MNPPFWCRNLLVYSLQIALMGGAGVLLPRCLKLRAPRVLYGYWQAVLGLCLLAPLVQPWRHAETASGISASSRLIFRGDVATTRLGGFPFARLILLLLAAGIGLRLLRLALGLATLRRYRQQALRVEALPAGIGAIAARLAVVPKFCVSEHVHGPVTFGWRNPVVFVPPCFPSMEADRQRAIAVHELLHVARRDWAVNLAEEAVLALWWFHPVVWWLVARIRLSREQIVDREVVDLTGSCQPYLHALLEIAAGPVAARRLLAPAFLNECQLAERIRSLVKEDYMSRRRILVSLVGASVLTLLVGLAVVRSLPLKAAGTPPAINNTQQNTGPEVYKVGNGVSAPKPIYKPDPQYTAKAKAAKIQGTVILSVVIGADGAVKDVEVSKPLDPGLDQKAEDAIRMWKFQPAMKSGKPVACKVKVEVSFKLF